MFKCASDTCTNDVSVQNEICDPCDVRNIIEESLREYNLRQEKIDQDSLGLTDSTR